MESFIKVNTEFFRVQKYCNPLAWSSFLAIILFKTGPFRLHIISLEPWRFFGNFWKNITIFAENINILKIHGNLLTIISTYKKEIIFFWQKWVQGIRVDWKFLAWFLFMDLVVLSMFYFIWGIIISWCKLFHVVSTIFTWLKTNLYLERSNIYL